MRRETWLVLALHAVACPSGYSTGAEPVVMDASEAGSCPSEAGDEPEYVPRMEDPAGNTYAGCLIPPCPPKSAM